MLARRPFADMETLRGAADEVWSQLSSADYLEAFAQHPQIGAELASLREKFASTSTWASGEQAGLRSADESTILALRDENLAYLRRFGHIFIVCASGKSAPEMLSLLRARLNNSAADELVIAAHEQSKITKLRLEKLA